MDLSLRKLVLRIKEKNRVKITMTTIIRDIQKKDVKYNNENIKIKGAVKCRTLECKFKLLLS